MVLKLYGQLSAAVMRPYCVLLEKGVEFELVPVWIARGETRTPEYLAKQPFGQIPCLDDDGFILYESRAICHYIASKYADQGPELIPKDLQKNALFQQWVGTESLQFDTKATAILVEEFYKPVLRGGVKDQQVYDDQLVALGKVLDIYERVLSKQKYLVGDEITLADIYHLPNSMLLGRNGGTKIMEDESRPNVVRWYKEISSRESWKATLAKAAEPRPF